MSIGIDKIGFATSQYVLNMADLALPVGQSLKKRFSKGLMLMQPVLRRLQKIS